MFINTLSQKTIDALDAEARALLEERASASRSLLAMTPRR